MITLGNMEATRTSWLLGATLKFNFKYEDKVFEQRGGCDKAVDLKERYHLK